MAFFGVTKEKIERIDPHTNADRLELCRLVDMDFQFVIGKGSYEVGQEVLYFPVDSLFPFELMELLDLTVEKERDGEKVLEGRLAGKNRNRLKTIKLRGEISQGLVAPLDILDKIPYQNKSISDFANGDIYDPETLTNYLQIEKYEVQSVDDSNNEYRKAIKKGNVIKRFFNKYYYCLYNVNVKMDRLSFLSKYDIEGADRYKKVVDEELMDSFVYITEKLEGSNLSLTYDVVKDTFYVNTRNRTINNYFSKHIWGDNHSFKDRLLMKMSKIGLLKPLKDTDRASGFYDLFKSKNMYEVLKDIADLRQAKQHVTIYGEYVGPKVQGNIYELKENDFYAFDIKVDDAFIDSVGFSTLCNMHRIQHVPVLCSVDEEKTLKEWLDGKTVQEASNGKSILNPKALREGIVIKPLDETYSQRMQGRLFIKQRSPEYLAKGDM